MKMKGLPPVAFLVLACMLSACDRTPKEWEHPNRTALTARLQPIFKKTKTVCFGRFMIDVPVSATISWGEADVPLGISVYPNGVDEVNALAQKFIDELSSEKAIEHNDVPLLVSAKDVTQPRGKIVTGYESFDAIDEFKINGYFRLNNDGIVVTSRPLGERKEAAIAEIMSIVTRLRQQRENEIPIEPGNCIENAFLIDKTNRTKDEIFEHIRIGFRLKEFADAHLSIYVAPANTHDPESDSLERQWKRIAADPDAKALMATTKFLRKSSREIHDWRTGYEVLTRTPDEEGSLSHHDFQVKFIGVPRDVFRPYADIQFVTGVGDNATGSIKPSLTDEEAIAVWDKITSTIRVRPTTAALSKTAGIGSPPLIPLGELAATGRICPQTGWWEPDGSSRAAGSHRQHISAGERMPTLRVPCEPSIWQKLKGEKPINRTATTWRLVAYGAEATEPNAKTQTDYSTEVASHANALTPDAGGNTKGKEDEQSPPQEG